MRIHPHAPIDQLEHELLHERAASLGRLGRGLEQALAELRLFDHQADRQAAAPERQMLVRNASLALWYFIVQREALGLRDASQLARDYTIPAEVWAAMGAIPRT